MDQSRILLPFRCACLDLVKPNAAYCKGRTPFEKVTKCHLGKWSRRIKSESSQEPYSKNYSLLTTATRMTFGQARLNILSIRLFI